MSRTLVQIGELVSKGNIVTIESPGISGLYEVTVTYNRLDGGHSHYGGDCLAEAVNRAWKKHA